MQIDPLRLIEVFIATAALWGLALVVAKGEQQRLILLAALFGFFVYSGIGTAYSDVPHYLVLSYFLFALALIGGFLIGKTIFQSFGRIVGTNSLITFERINTRKFVITTITTLLILKATYLIYPEFKLLQLLNPPAPDILRWFLDRFDAGPTILEKVLNYIELFITPFLYIALFFLRHSIAKIVFVLAIILYFDYVDTAYISRGTVVVSFLFVLLVLWFERPRLRIPLLAVAVISAPVILSLMHAYTSIRLGGTAENIDIFSAALTVLFEETSFLLNGGVLVIESGKQVDLVKYFAWVLTLPIPGFLKGSLPVALINYEISAIVIGRQLGEAGFYVSLVGLLAESYYIYGPYFYWLHGAFLGFVISLFPRITERVPCYRFLGFYIAILLLHSLNRGGVGSVLPVLVNGFLAFFFFLLIISSRFQK